MRALKIIISLLVISLVLPLPVFLVNAELPEEIPIGALMALTGPLTSFGKRQTLSAQMAIDDVNAYVAKLGLNVRFKLLVEDTKVLPEEALARIQSLAAQGVKVVVGPLASSEVAAVKSFADSNKIVVISHSSTAPSLSIPGDFIFRFVPTDVFQGRALARLAEALGLSKVVAIYRGDPWGDGLYEAFKENFEELGGEVKGVRYDPNAKDLSPEVRKASELVSEYGIGPDVGVLLISFEDDGIAVLMAAREDPVLMGVKWLGTDGTAMSSKIVEQVGDVAVKLGSFLNTLYNPAFSPKQEEFRKRFIEVAGEEPDAYCYNIYDAVWVAALAIIETRSYDGEAIAKVLPDVASRYFGVSGWTLLDEAGDRAGGDYGIWSVVDVDGKYEWKLIGTYSYTSDSVTFKD